MRCAKSSGTPASLSATAFLAISARDEHEARRVAPKLLTPGEQFDARALQKTQDAERELGKLFFGDLEQFATRKRL